MKYKLSEFRKNTREAFNLAEQDKIVTIERHGIKFALIREDHFNIQNHNFVVEEAKKAIGYETDKNGDIKGVVFVKLCKHGADPKLCKHAKPGKECK